MTPSELVTIIGNAISDGMSCLLHLQSLRAAPPALGEEDRDAWCDTLARCNEALESVIRGTSHGRPMVSSWRPSDDLVPAIESVRAHLLALPAGVPLPASLFDLVDAAWAEFQVTGAAAP